MAYPNICHQRITKRNLVNPIVRSQKRVCSGGATNVVITMFSFFLSTSCYFFLKRSRKNTGCQTYGSIAAHRGGTTMHQSHVAYVVRARDETSKCTKRHDGQRRWSSRAFFLFCLRRVRAFTLYRRNVPVK